MKKFSIFNAYKIHDLEPERHVQAWFLTLFTFYSILFLSFDGQDLLTRILSQILYLFLEPAAPLTQISSNFLLHLCVYLPVSFIGYILSLSYSITYINKVTKKETRSALPNVLKKFFPLLIFAIISGGIYVISSFFMLIPYFIFMSMFYYVPVEIVFGERSLPEAMARSWHLTKGRKVFITASVITVTFLLRYLTQFAADSFASTSWAASLLLGFSYTFRDLASGRLNALLYLLHTGVIREREF